MKDHRRRHVILGSVGVFSVASVAALAAWTSSESVGTSLDSGQFGVEVAVQQDENGDWDWTTGHAESNYAEISFLDLMGDIDPDIAWGPGDTHAAPVALRLSEDTAHPALLTHSFHGDPEFDDAFTWEYLHADGADAPTLNADAIGDADYAFGLTSGEEVVFELTVEATDDLEPSQEVQGVWTFTAEQQTDQWQPPTLVEYFTFEDRAFEGVPQTIIGYSEDGPRDVVIPRQIGGQAVTRLGFDAFPRSGLTSVVIPDSVTAIDNSAFTENDLTDVTIPDTVTAIHSFTFSRNQLESVSLGNSVETIGAGAFASNNLSSLTIPESVIEIGRNAFLENDLTTVWVPDSVTSIGSMAFADNPLETVSLPAGIAYQPDSFPAGTTIVTRD